MRQTNTSICLAVSVPSNSLRYSVDSIERVKLRSFDIHDALNIDAGEKFALSMECTSMHRYMICSKLKMAFIKSKTIARYFISDVVCGFISYVHAYICRLMPLLRLISSYAHE